MKNQNGNHEYSPKQITGFITGIIILLGSLGIGPHFLNSNEEVLVEIRATNERLDRIDERLDGIIADNLDLHDRVSYLEGKMGIEK